MLVDSEPITHILGRIDVEHVGPPPTSAALQLFGERRFVGVRKAKTAAERRLRSSVVDQLERWCSSFWSHKIHLALEFQVP